MEKEYRIGYEYFGSLGELPPGDRELVEGARGAAATSHAPYSRHRVGAAARLSSGIVLTGSNQESEVLPAGVCAERSLLYHWQANHSGDPIEAIALASDPDTGECYPCGVCRQVLVDTERRQGAPLRVVMSGAGTASVVARAADLLPFTFKI